MRGPDFSCVVTQVKMFRNISYYILRIYGPSFLMVITAFVSFWIPPVGYPARVAVTATPLLALITQQITINGEVMVSYIVALHLWIMVCQFFVFMSLVEFAAAIVNAHVVEDRKALSASCSSDRSASRSESGLIHSKGRSRVTRFIKLVLFEVYGEVDFSKNAMDRNMVDYISRIVFPLFYTLFIIGYFLFFYLPWITSKYYHDL